MSLRLALRRLRRTPGLTLASILALGLGIGATVAVVALLDAALLRPLPVTAPERLMAVYGSRPDSPYRSLTYADYVDTAELTAPVTEGVAAAAATEVALTGVGEPRLVAAALVSGNYFEVMGVAPVLGSSRAFAESAAAEATIVAIGHDLWQRLFAGAEDVLGREVTLHGHPYRVVAVLPPRFAGHVLAERAELWLPLAAYPRVATGFWASFDAVDYEAQRHGRRIAMWNVLARLRPGVGEAEAAAAFAAAGRELVTRFPESHDAADSLVVVPAARAALPLAARDESVRFLGLLGGAVALALLLAAASVAILQLARTRRRREETGLRLALGAGRLRLVRDLLLEILLLAAAGGLAGVLLASWLLALAGAYRLPGDVSLASLDPRLDPRVLAVAALVTLSAAALAALAPAWSGLRTSPATILRSRGRDRAQQTWRAALVAAQVAVAVVLLTGLGLVGRSLLAAWSSDLGFDAAGVLTVTVDLGPRQLGAAGAERFFTRLSAETEALPGVVATALTAVPFGDQGLSVGSVALDDGRVFEDVDIPLTRVSRDYFATMGITLRDGAGFADPRADEGLVINERLARRLWPGERAVGHGINFSGPAQPTMPILGVVASGRYWSLADDSDYVYLPLEDSWDAAAGNPMTLLVRTAGDPLRLAEPVAAILHDLDPELPISAVTTLEGRLAELLLPQRMAAGVLGFFGLLALVLAVVGVAGVVAFAVDARRREMGIRLALGARPRILVGDLVRRGLAPVVTGAVAGTLLAALGADLLVGLLYEIDPLDPPTFVAVVAVLLLASALAALVPARRAGRVDPAAVLREE